MNCQGNARTAEVVIDSIMLVAAFANREHFELVELALTWADCALIENHELCFKRDDDSVVTTPYGLIVIIGQDK